MFIYIEVWTDRNRVGEHPTFLNLLPKNIQVMSTPCTNIDASFALDCKPTWLGQTVRIEGDDGDYGDYRR